MALSQSRLKELFNYDAVTGIFTRNKAASGTRVGKIVGARNKDGYLSIRVDDKIYLAHRLAWLYVYGVWPSEELDHKNGIKHHNYIDNLRDVNKLGNMQNQLKAHSHSKTGLIGACFHKASGTYVAQIKTNGKVKHLGCFATPEEAHASYVSAKRRLHDTCTI